jgi:hypothetical protein
LSRVDCIEVDQRELGDDIVGAADEPRWTALLSAGRFQLPEVVVRAPAELDAAAAPVFGAELGAVQANADVVVDLTAVVYCGSAGMRATPAFDRLVTACGSGITSSGRTTVRGWSAGRGQRVRAPQPPLEPGGEPMPNPQDPGLRRSEKDAAVQDAWVNDATGGQAESGATGPVPEDNRPGHHPDREQDKPTQLGGAGHGEPS